MTRVVFYCPDRHIVYDGRTPYEVGVGGGISARIRIARALSRLGHEVVMAANCRKREVIDGVEYLPLDECRSIEGDVLIASTSSGDLDLRSMLKLEIDVRLKGVWVHGTAKPEGLEAIDFDMIYCVSNFIAGIARDEWGVPGDRLFVVYNPYEEQVFAEAERLNPQRDPFRLVYFSHPSKGLDSAIAVLELLRAEDPRFHLEVFGGIALWGQAEADPPEAEGVRWHGLVGQKDLAHELLKSSFSIQLQSREEPGALAIMDALRAGCIIIGSPVGCYPEMIKDGENGFLIPGDHGASVVCMKTASLVGRISQDSVLIDAIRQNAQSLPWESSRMAQVWVEHWDWRCSGGLEKALEGGNQGPSLCISCNGMLLKLSDGDHCAECGRYFY